MVTEQEKEELGRLTHQRIKAFSQQQQELSDNPGRMTLQNIESMKSSACRKETGEAKIKLLLDRLKMAVTTSMSGLFQPSQKRIKEDRCKTYGHNFPFGTTWKGAYPKCLDCNKTITDASQLRGALPTEERNRFRGYSEK